jgi:hypothetical protein
MIAKIAGIEPLGDGNFWQFRRSWQSIAITESKDSALL